MKLAMNCFDVNKPMFYPTFLLDITETFYTNGYKKQEQQQVLWKKIQIKSLKLRN